MNEPPRRRREGVGIGIEGGGAALLSFQQGSTLNQYRDILSETLINVQQTPRHYHDIQPSELTTSSNLLHSGNQNHQRSTINTMTDRHKLQCVCRERRQQKFEYHQYPERVGYFSCSHLKMMLVLPYLLLATLAITYTLCLDSPVKIQRNRPNAAALVSPSTPKQLHSQFADEDAVPVFLNQSNSLSFEQKSSAIRARKANQINSSQQYNNVNNREVECPANRLFQSLLSPEYKNLHQHHQQQQQHRAYCDCTADLFGWQVTCFASGGQSPGGNMNRPISQAEPLPNQLHPAFRGPQLQRQQQQQAAAAAAANHQLRRVYRSTLLQDRGNWMGDESLVGKNESSSLKSASELHTELDSSLSHEGFGEDSIPASQTTQRPLNLQNNKLTRSQNQHSKNLTRTRLEGGEVEGLDPSDESFMSLSSSDSFTMMHLQQSDSDTSNSNIQAAGSSRMGSSEKLIQQPSNLNNIQQHLTFQTVPVLFSVKYIRNNMIEIDCDQAAPHYKPAMFQGFGVNEISSFTFNNCQLPSVPFSVLLHRTGSVASGGSSSNSNAIPNPLSMLSGHRTGTSSRLRHQNSLLNQRKRRRRRNSLPSDSSEDEAPPVTRDESKHPVDSSPEVEAALLPKSELGEAREMDGAGSGSNSPRSATHPSPLELTKIRSLTVNLATVIEQRQLISLLTGLDQLEDLQLNYMQLNMTGFELPLASDLDAETSAAAQLSSPPLSKSPATAPIPNSSNILLSVTGSGPPPTNNVIPTLTMATSGTSASAATTTRSPSTLVLTASSPTTPIPPITTTSTSSSSQKVTAASPPPPPPPQTQPFTNSNRLAQTQTTNYNPPMTTLISGSGSNAQPTGSTTTSRPLTTQTTTATQPTTTRQRQPAPSVQMLRPAQATPKPSLGLGAPRGLITGQATGTPAAPTTQTLPGTTTPIPSLGTDSRAVTTGTTVPSVPLSTVLTSSQISRQSATTRSATTPTPWSGNGISVANTGQSVSYTNQVRSVASTTQPATTILNTNSQLISTTSNAHMAPSSGWYQNTPPTQGTTSSSQLTSTGGSGLMTTPINTPQASSLHSSGYGIRTGGSSAPLPVSLNIYNSNTPFMGRINNQGGGPTTLNGGTSVGLRSFGPFTGGLSNNNFNSIMNQNRRVSDSNSNGIQTSPFTAASGISRLPATMAGRRQQQQQQQPNNNIMSFNNPGTTTTTTNNNNNNMIHSQPTTSEQDLLSLLAATEHSAGSLGTSSASSALSDSSELIDTSGTLDSSLFSRIQHQAGTSTSAISSDVSARFKRQAVGLNEFELSFGEILPNLRTLKLESFIDLSVGSPSTSNMETAPLTNRKQQNRRFKRQFHPSDAPVRDESHMSDSESDESLRVGNGAGADSLLAEESNNPAAHSSSSSQHLMMSAERLAPSISSLSPSSTDWPRDDRERDRDRGEPQVSASSSANQAANLMMARKRATLLVRMFSKLSKLRILQLTSNEIPFWPDNVLLDSRHSLQRLYLGSNNIRQLGANSFANLTELETLDLSANQLRQLSSDLFKDLWSLRQLRAVRNLFRKLPSRLFGQTSRPQRNQVTNGTNTIEANTAQQGQQKRHRHRQHYAIKLESLDFSKNKYLAHIPADLFAQRAPLVSLNLSDCALSDQMSVSGKQMAVELLFAALPELTSVSLRANKLNEFLNQPGLWAKNSRLQRLDLSHNQISILNPNLFNANASQLQELQLQHNQLTQVPDQFLFNLRNLKRISLAHNKLTQLGAKLFLTNSHIEAIDLSHNQLISLGTQQSSMIPFGNGAKLRQLNLSHNNLTNFDTDIFDIAWSFYTNLQQLDLSHNQFSGQIGVPIFYTITDELTFDLGANSIQSVSVDALVQHEQILDRYAAYEAAEASGRVDGIGSGRGAAFDSSGQGASQQRVPSVHVKLAGNPIACDCMLEPLISYSRRVAAATNPALLSSLFSGPAATSSQREPGLAASSRYSVLSQDNVASASIQSPRNPQLFYQFKFNDLFCARPTTLRKRPLSHISIGDLLCPIIDERLCPNECQCHYQSAFKTAIVDCNGRQLSKVPEQLTSANNFAHFQVESAFASDQQQNFSTPMTSQQTGGPSQPQIARQVIASVDKVIIRLDNNKLSSMADLVRLFTVVSNPLEGATGGRYARADGERRRTQVVDSTADIGSEASSLAILHNPSPSSATPQNETINGKRSPASIGRSMHSSGSIGQRQRQRRQLSLGDQLGDSTNDQPTPQGSSTAVLESAEEFRNKHYPITSCELYLDHNLIESIPLAFLEMLDQVRASSMQSALTPPQAALPTLMLEPPLHTKLNYVDNNLSAGNNLGPITTTAATDSTSTSASAPEASLEEPEANHLFSPVGHQPLSAERKAALMETISHNVRLQADQQSGQFSTFGRSQSNNGADTVRAAGLLNEPKVWVSPALAVLSLRHNKLAGISVKVLQRLSKLIRTSSTKLYLGHNPFNCSDNYAPLDQSRTGSPTSGQGISSGELDSSVPTAVLSPVGDQLMAASDASSGTYLAEAADDLAPAASDPAGSAAATALAPAGPLLPADCPIGQLKSWLTRHHSSVGDLDELYCVHGSPELAARIKAANNSSASDPILSPRDAQGVTSTSRWEHEHPWASPLGGNSSASGWSISSSTGELLALVPGARLIELNMYDLCPYSGTPLLDSSASGLLSQTHQQILISVALAFILISLLLLMMLIYFGDTQTILAFVYIHMNPLYTCLRLSESHLDGDKLYDAFVSYSSEDRDIVMQLIDRLERPDIGTEASSARSSTQQIGADPSGGETLSRRTNSFQDLTTMSRSTSRIMLPGDEGTIEQQQQYKSSKNEMSQQQQKQLQPYRLCIHERDWLPGHLISWNIVNSVQNSRRTILILSKDFIKSVWFSVEFHTAYYQMLEDKINRLIVIVRGELPPKSELDKNLAFLLTTKTYLTWGEKWFWERLHYALPHKTRPPTATNMPSTRSMKQHHHHYAGPAKLTSQKQNDNSNELQQKPLVMSSIGKDVSNLLLPSSQQQQHQSSHNSSNSSSTVALGSSSSSAASGGARSLASSASSGNLLAGSGATATTSNELLSSSTTRLTIGSPPANSTDSGRGLSSSQLADSSTQQQLHRSPGVTSIMLDGSQQPQQQMLAASTQPNSRIRTKKQERLQNFVDQTISNHFNLSEL